MLWWTGRDLNPRPPECKSTGDETAFSPKENVRLSTYLCGNGVHCSELDSRVDWDAFKAWLRREYRPKTAYDYLYYVKKYAHCLLDGDFKPLLDLSSDKRHHCMAALSALSKFLGIHGQFSALVKDYGLKWSERSDDLIIARFTKSVDPDEVFNWMKQVKAECPKLCDFIDFMATTGLRYGEAVQSYNLIVKLAREDKLNQYYDGEREVLEHFRFKDIFLRRSKKVFVSFVPKALIECISKGRPVKAYGVQTKVKRKVKKLRFGDIREVHGTLLTKHLNEVEINFLHGRVGSSVFMRNYFNPTWITDLKDRTFKAVNNIMERINA